MNLLYISYWGHEEGITQGAVLPYLSILSSFDEVTSIIWCSVEREAFTNTKVSLPNKVKHIPFISKPKGPTLLKKLEDFTAFPKQVTSIINQYQIDKVIARSSMAAAFALLSKKKTPLIIESFEPHADYMRDAGEWSKVSYKNSIQRYFEKRAKKEAQTLITVSNNYKKKLAEEGVIESKLELIPCCVSSKKFKFVQSDRSLKRSLLKLNEDAYVGVYVGKFGGIYYDESAFNLFFKIAQSQPQFHLLLLTPSNKRIIEEKLTTAGLKKHQFSVLSVKHEEVPKYLSASDFAIDLHQHTAHSFAFSPIKNGEYLMNGLPILLPPSIGDDSEIVLNKKAGAIFNILDDKSIEKALDCLKNILSEPDYRERIQNLGIRYRSFDLAKIVYRKVLGIG